MSEILLKSSYYIQTQNLKARLNQNIIAKWKNKEKLESISNLDVESLNPVYKKKLIRLIKKYHWITEEDNNLKAMVENDANYQTQ